MNYGDLKTHFNALLNRSDITPALSTTFIDQGIGRIQRQLRVPMMEKTKKFSLTSATASIALPSDFLEIISIYHSTNELVRIPISRFRQLSDSQHTGKPRFFSRIQEAIQFHPQPADGDLILYYYGEFTNLVDDADTNILLQVASDLVLYSSLSYAADYYLDERSTIFETKFNQFLSEIQEQANDQELNGSTQLIMPAYFYQDGEY